MSIKTKLSVVSLAVSLVFSHQALAENVTVYAAASMTNALQDIAKNYQQKNKADQIKFSFASSSTLAKQIEEGAPAQIFVSADNDWMKYLSDKQLTIKKTEKLLAGNRLVLISPLSTKLYQVNLNNTAWFKSLGGIFLSVGDPSHVPAGKYAKAAFTKLGYWSQIEPHIVRAKDVRASLSYVERGEVPYGVVYSTDAKQSGKVRIVGEFAANLHPAIEYPVAQLKRTSKASQQFYNYLTSNEAKKVFQQYGFITR